jgi:alpha-ketoglutarate-dependent taurine dioxygenase
MIAISPNPQTSIKFNSQPLCPFGLLLEATEPQSDIRKLSIPQLRQLTWEHSLIVLRGFSSLQEEVLPDYCTNWGTLLTWDFGTVLNLVVHDNPQNYLFTTGNVPFHWDGAFAKAVPSFLFFQCLQAPSAGSGGESLFCHTTRVLQNATPEERQAWQKINITYKTQKLAHYGGKITAPLVSQHPITDNSILRFAEPLNEDSVHLNPLFLEISGLASGKPNQFLNDLIARLYLPQHCFAHQWQEGDILIADNHALLHGRNPFLANSPRHLQRVHIL